MTTRALLATRRTLRRLPYWDNDRPPGGWASRADYEQLRPHVSGTFKADFGGTSLNPRENARSMPRSIQNWKIRALEPCCGSRPSAAPSRRYVRIAAS